VVYGSSIKLRMTVGLLRMTRLGVDDDGSVQDGGVTPGHPRSFNTTSSPTPIGDPYER